MITLLSLIICLSLLHDLSKLKIKYIKILNYSLYYIFGIFIEFLFWILLLYFQYNNYRTNYTKYIIPLFPIGFALFYKGLVNLDKITQNNDIGTKIHEKGLTFFTGVSIFIISLALIIFIVK